MARGCHTEGRDGWKPDIEEVQFLLKKLIKKATYSTLVKAMGLQTSVATFSVTDSRMKLPSQQRPTWACTASRSFGLGE